MRVRLGLFFIVLLFLLLVASNLKADRVQPSTGGRSAVETTSR